MPTIHCPGVIPKSPTDRIVTDAQMSSDQFCGGFGQVNESANMAESVMSIRNATMRRPIPDTDPGPSAVAPKSFPGHSALS